jgi:exo-beta-1,3-glucanase (GH17 family)
MRVPIVLFAAAAVVIVAAWAWLGRPVPMPPSPLAAGEKLYCVSYAPFRGSQNPLDAGTRISAAQIDEDLARLSKITDCVRTYSIEHGLDQIAGIAGRYGLKVMQGLWLSGLPQKNEVEIATAIALAKRHPDVIRSIVVGNEVLLRGEMAAADLAATIRRVKQAVPVPVTYADVWEFWLRNPAVYDAVDFVTIHILPYWEDFPIRARDAAAHVDSIRARLVAAFPAKEILIGETGWPSAGRMREGALPSPADQARVLHEVLAAAKRGNYRVNVIEALDQPWKRRLEGTVGGHWGLLDDRRREPKFVWGAAVSNHPAWKLQAGLGVALAAVVFAAGWTSRRASDPPAPAARWAMVGLMAAVAGIAIGWTVEKVALESLGWGQWVRSGILLFAAGAAPLLAAVALMREAAVPRFGDVLVRQNRERLAATALLLGLVLITVTVLAIQIALGLVFDPRYKDFPFPGLAAAVLPLSLLAIRRQPSGSGSTAATAEILSALTLGLAAGYIALNEGFGNWQARITVIWLLLLSLTLLRFADARSRG